MWTVVNACWYSQRIEHGIMNDEKWHEGWRREGDVIYIGHPYCAGCGTSLGCACIAIDSNWTPPPEPRWPFPADDCPLCSLRDSKTVESLTLQQRLAIFKQARRHKDSTESMTARVSPHTSGQWWNSGLEVGSGPTMAIKVARVSGANYDEALANAKLIAAAPALLEALQDLWAASVGTSDEEITARIKARLAIAKATE